MSNVDSQASFDNIVIQVIGETSNKAGEPKKFVQTFVLAQQPSGYFVLNDILRYIDEDSDDDSAAPAVEEGVEMPEAPAAETAASEEPEAAKSVAETEEEEEEEETAQLDPTVVDQKLEEVSSSKEAPAVNGSTPESTEEAKPADTKSEASVADPETAVQQLAEEDAKVPEQPQDPSPTPVSKPAAAAPPTSAPAPPAAPAKVEPAAPPKPMTWASRAAAAAGPKPVVPLAKTTTPPATTRAPAAASAAAAPTSQPAAAAAAAPSTEALAAKEAAGWQTAGSDSKRQTRPQSISGAPTEKEGTLGYVKYVTEKVQDADLKNALAAHGELTYFDINRQKVCNISL